MEKIINFIQETIAESCGIDTNIIKKESTLFDELSISSIDLIDILYEIEMEYDIRLKISDIEKDTIKLLNGKKFSKRGKITEEALQVLKQNFTEIPQEKLKFGIKEREFIKLITVETLAKLVIRKVNAKN